MNEDLRALIDAWLTGEITEDQSAELDRALREDPQAARLFAELARQEQDLRRFHRTRSDQRAAGQQPLSARHERQVTGDGPNRSDQRSTRAVSRHAGASGGQRLPRRTQRTRRRRTPIPIPILVPGLAVAALLVIGVVLLLREPPAPPVVEPQPVVEAPEMTPLPSEPAGPTVATLIEAVGLRVDGVPVALGAELAAGARVTTTAEGRATMRFDDGSTAVLGAGCELVLPPAGDATELVLERGRVVSEVQPRSAPYAVGGEHGRVTVLGTRFSVERQGARSLAAVERGRVQVAPTSGTAVELGPRDEAEFDASGIRALRREVVGVEAWRRYGSLADERDGRRLRVAFTNADLPWQAAAWYEPEPIDLTARPTVLAAQVTLPPRASDDDTRGVSLVVAPTLDFDQGDLHRQEFQAETFVRVIAIRGLVRLETKDGPDADEARQWIDRPALWERVAPQRPFRLELEVGPELVTLRLDGEQVFHGPHSLPLTSAHRGVRVMNKLLVGGEAVVDFRSWRVDGDSP